MGTSLKTGHGSRTRSRGGILTAAMGFFALVFVPSVTFADPAATEANGAFHVQGSVQIPMRDGIHLSADVYRPRGQSGPLPVILMRTPYGKNSKSGSIELFSRRWTFRPKHRR